MLLGMQYIKIIYEFVYTIKVGVNSNNLILEC